MRFDRVIVIIMCGLLGCDEPPGAGTAGHECHGWPSYGCEGDLECVDDTCIECGGDGQACCDNAKPCKPGLACDGNNDTGRCQDDCGLDGKPCCPNGCPGGGACNDSNTCDAAAGDPCFSGTKEHDVAVIDGNCGLQVIPLFTNSDAEAEACREQIVAAAAQDAEVCPVDTKPDTATVCQDGWGPLYLWHCSDQQLQLCEYNLCVNGCTYTDPDAGGHCPLGP
jgi:hypothetical protein